MQRDADNHSGHRIHKDNMPKEMQEAIKQLSVLCTGRQQKTELKPGEKHPCVYWLTMWSHVGSLAGGKTIQYVYIGVSKTSEYMPPVHSGIEGTVPYREDLRLCQRQSGIRHSSSHLRSVGLAPVETLQVVPTLPLHPTIKRPKRVIVRETQTSHGMRRQRNTLYRSELVPMPFCGKV